MKQVNRNGGGGAHAEGMTRGRRLLSLLLSTTIFGLAGSFSVGPAYAQSASRQAATSQPVNFSIPAQPLSSAINAFIRATGWQISYSSQLARGKTSVAVVGAMPPSTALQRLVAGTGLSVRIGGSGSAALVGSTDASAAAPAGAISLDTIDVQGENPNSTMTPMPAYAGGQVATGGQVGMLGNRSVMNTPFNQTSYTAKLIQDQQARSIPDVVSNNPSVQTYARNSTRIDSLVIRGFPAPTEQVMYGGLAGILPTDTTNPELAERIEVLTGPSAMLNNVLGSIGGTINIVPKRAPEERLARFTPSYGSRGNLGGHVDYGQRFGTEKQFGVRFNGVYRDGESAVKDTFDQRKLAVLGLDYRGDRLRLSADLGWQKLYLQGVTPNVAFNPGVPVLPAPDANRNPGAAWTFKDNEDKFVALRGEYDLTENVTAYAAWGRHEWDRTLQDACLLRITDPSGAALVQCINLQRFISDTQSANAGIRARFETGPVAHEFTLGAATYEYVFRSAQAGAPSYVSNLYAPTSVPRPNLTLPPLGKSYASELSSLAVADTMSVLDKRIQLMLGARYQNIKETTFNGATGAQTSSNGKSALSPSVGLLVKPLENVSLYGNFIQGLEAGEVVGANFSNAGTAFPPYTSIQYETGIKVDWGKWTTTASLFQITKPGVITDFSTNTRVLNGEQRNRGAELNIFGEPIEGIRVLGGAMFLDPILTKTQGGLTDGWMAPASPRFQLRLGGEWDTPFASGLTLTGRVLHTSEQYIDTDAPRRSIPAWTRFDVGARYTFDASKTPTGKPIVVRLNIENVLGTNYWGNIYQVAAPRTVWLSTTFDF